MKFFRLYVSDGKEATGAGCLLTALAAVVTVVLGLAFGPAVVAWVTPVVPWVGRRVAVALVCGVLLAPGALLFWAGALVLRRRGIPAWREVEGGERESRPAP